ncbi:MAG: histidine phosphatase family protein [Bifidobacteriaceae bacterium]|jgi:probable phosphoglycerate mutase|nr:histidine phosphatase family protein [Bifidobacteriaceae bacterium]
MTAKRVVIWRHGQTPYNLHGRIQGASDVALDQTGLDQAAQAARRLVLEEPAALWSSDLVRAYATATALAELTGLEVVTDRRLREREFGSWEGLAVADIQRRWPDRYERWQAGEDLPEIGMETRDQAAKRMTECVREAAAGVADGETLVVTSHGGVSVCGLTGLLELDPANWLGLKVMRNAHWAVLEGSGRRYPAWRLAGYDLGEGGQAGLSV